MIAAILRFFRAKRRAMELAPTFDYSDNPDEFSRDWDRLIEWSEGAVTELGEDQIREIREHSKLRKREMKFDGPEAS